MGFWDGLGYTGRPHHLQQEKAPSPGHVTASFSLGYYMSHCVLSLPYPFYVIILV